MAKAKFEKFRHAFTHFFDFVNCITFILALYLYLTLKKTHYLHNVLAYSAIERFIKISVVRLKIEWNELSTRKNGDFCYAPGVNVFACRTLRHFSTISKFIEVFHLTEKNNCGKNSIERAPCCVLTRFHYIYSFLMRSLKSTCYLLA